jgi:hypothetical protein
MIGKLYVPAALLPMALELEDGVVESSLDAFEEKNIIMPLKVIEHTLLVTSARILVTVATELSSLAFVAYILV